MKARENLKQAKQAEEQAKAEMKRVNGTVIQANVNNRELLSLLNRYNDSFADGLRLEGMNVDEFRPVLNLGECNSEVVGHCPVVNVSTPNYINANSGSKTFSDYLSSNSSSNPVMSSPTSFPQSSSFYISPRLCPNNVDCTCPIGISSSMLSSPVSTGSISGSVSLINSCQGRLFQGKGKSFKQDANQDRPDCLRFLFLFNIILYVLC
jgi:hypothetical protein